jgi:hypothetical protein
MPGTQKNLGQYVIFERVLAQIKSWFVPIGGLWAFGIMMALGQWPVDCMFSGIRIKGSYKKSTMGGRAT